MMGHAKDYGKRSAGFGWLNPYFSRTTDGDTEYQDYTVISKTNLDLKIDPEIEFYDFGRSETP